MRIYYDHQLTSLQDAGGASRYHYELARYLAAQAELDTTFFLGTNSTLYPYADLRSPHTRVVTFSPLLPKGPRRYIVNEALANAAALVQGRFDIYHPSHHRIVPWVRARRTVVTHHDCIYERFPGFRFTERVLRAKGRLFPRADMIICISESCRQDLYHYYAIEPSRTRVVHHGFTRLSRSPEGEAELSPFLRRDFLLFVGTRAHYKNFDALLRAYAAYGLQRDFDLLVLGGGPLSDEHSSLIAALGLDRFIVALPGVSDAALAEAYARARLFVYPSLWEGFGFPPLEAMALGCPVAASRVAAIPEVCGGAPFYFDPADVDSIAAALLAGVSDETARTHAIACGRRVTGNFSWEKCAAETLAVYRECL